MSWFAGGEGNSTDTLTIPSKLLTIIIEQHQDLLIFNYSQFTLLHVQASLKIFPACFRKSKKRQKKSLRPAGRAVTYSYVEQRLKVQTPGRLNRALMLTARHNFNISSKEAVLLAGAMMQR